MTIDAADRGELQVVFDLAAGSALDRDLAARYRATALYSMIHAELYSIEEAVKALNAVRNTAEMNRIQAGQRISWEPRSQTQMWELAQSYRAVAKALMIEAGKSEEEAHATLEEVWWYTLGRSIVFRDEEPNLPPQAFEIKKRSGEVVVVEGHAL